MTTPNETTQTTSTETETTSTGQEPTTETVTETETPSEEVPAEVLRKELTQARAEAANYRTRLREAEAKLSEAKTPEEYQAAVTELAAKNAELERSLLVASVAQEHQLPPELAELLKGDDAEALKAHAKVLAKFIVPEHTPNSLSGGLTPDESDEPFDPVKQAQMVRRSRF